MKRRVALKSLAVVVAGVVFLPGCDLSSKSSTEAVQSFLPPAQDKLLASITDTFIPATDTPGASALEVPAYIKVMLADCHEQEVQKIFFKGLDKVERLSEKKFGKGFSSLETAQQQEILKTMEAGEQPDKDFYALVKGLTVQGYMTSEYVMTNLTGYQMIPGHYYGCVPVTEKQKV